MSQSRYGRKKKLMAEINVVPYIDVMLVLLIIFMGTAPLLSTGVKVDLPKAAAEPMEDVDEEPCVLTVDAEGNYDINDDEWGKKAGGSLSYDAPGNPAFFSYINMGMPPFDPTTPR